MTCRFPRRRRALVDQPRNPRDFAERPPREFRKVLRRVDVLLQSVESRQRLTDLTVTAEGSVESNSKP